MKEESKGEVDISREAIAALAAEAAAEVEGVQTCQQKAVDTLASRVKREFVHRGVKVDKDDSTCRLTLYLKAPCGAHLPSLAKEVRGRVKEYVEGVTGLEVEQVDIVIEELDLEPCEHPSPEK